MSLSTPGAPEESFISHLIELRSRIVKAGAVVLLVFVCLMPWAAHIYDFLAAPMIHSLPAGNKMIATGVITPFLVPIKVTMLLAFIISLPWVLYQVWAFIAPGLYSHEKKLVAPLVISSSLLFVAGVVFCYYVVFGVIFHFINSFAPQSINVAPDIDAYVGFVMTMFLCFGLAFEVPILVIIVVRTGLVPLAKLKAMRRYVIVAAFVLAAIVTPPDIMSQLLLAGPLCILFELGLLFAPLFVRATSVVRDVGQVK